MCDKVGVYKEAKNRVGGTYGLRDCGRAGGPGSEQKAGVGAKFLFFKIFLSIASTVCRATKNNY